MVLIKYALKTNRQPWEANELERKNIHIVFFLHIFYWTICWFNQEKKKKKKEKKHSKAFIFSMVL